MGEKNQKDHAESLQGVDNILCSCFWVKDLVQRERDGIMSRMNGNLENSEEDPIPNIQRRNEEVHITN